MTDKSERALHIRNEIAVIRALGEERVWSESQYNKRNISLMASIPGLLSMLEETLAQLIQMTSARDELAEIANYLDTYVPKFPATGGTTGTQRRIEELKALGLER
jgi:hypothetical protein